MHPQLLQRITTNNHGSAAEKTKPIKANFATPKVVEQGLGDDCNRDMMVCRMEIWYKALITRSTGIFRCL